MCRMERKGVKRHRKQSRSKERGERRKEDGNSVHANVIWSDYLGVIYVVLC